MNLYQTKLFTTLQKEYKNKYGVDISQFVKLTNSSINFDKFEKEQLTIKQKNVIKSIQKNNIKQNFLQHYKRNTKINMELTYHNL
ncbi:hypothetical protein AB1P01_05215 (plasmid) [Borreliella burgdorferi]|uniref:hypothetical protein n=1 Tax=Borreliella burgdorferi TaxID=139 RepID=UPI00346380DB